MNIAYASIEDMQTWAAAIMASRAPDVIIGDPERPYLRRWWVIPRNALCNVYLHEILRSDDDRAGHDHPWPNTSVVIDGSYEEVIYFENAPWVELDRVPRVAGDVVARPSTATHRLIVPDGGRAVTLFMTGPKEREWGFWCPGTPNRDPRFVDWRAFTGGANGEIVGLGCEA